VAFLFGFGITLLRDMSLHRNGPVGRCELAAFRPSFPAMLESRGAENCSMQARKRLPRNWRPCDGP
jgi:hypothetical protein